MTETRSLGKHIFTFMIINALLIRYIELFILQLSTAIIDIKKSHNHEKSLTHALPRSETKNGSMRVIYRDGEGIRKRGAFARPNAFITATLYASYMYVIVSCTYPCIHSNGQTPLKMYYSKMKIYATLTRKYIYPNPEE